MHVDVRLDHGKGRFLSLCKLLASECVTIVDELELSGVDCQDRADEELVSGDTLDRHSLEEHSAVFQIVLPSITKLRDARGKQKIGRVLTMSTWPSFG